MFDVKVADYSICRYLVMAFHFMNYELVLNKGHFLNFANMRVIEIVL